jgi:hypothetical protein
MGQGIVRIRNGKVRYSMICSTHALSDKLDLRILECEALQRVFDMLLLALPRFDVLDLQSLLPQPSHHTLLLAGEEEEERLAL